jgi:hypothetical protein
MKYWLRFAEKCELQTERFTRCQHPAITVIYHPTSPNAKPMKACAGCAEHHLLYKDAIELAPVERNIDNATLQAVTNKSLEGLDEIIRTRVKLAVIDAIERMNKS